MKGKKHVVWVLAFDIFSEIPQANRVLDLITEHGMTSVVLDNVRVDFPTYGAERSLRSALFKRATGGVIQREGKHDERVVIRALSEISMALGEGDRLGLIGHNGSGKSTLLRVIAGIYEPFIANPAAKHELGGYGDEWAECIGASIEDMDGSACERPHIHLPFKLCLQYRILKDSPYRMVPSFQIYNDDTGQRILITYPAQAGPTTAGNYQANCVVDPFVLNVGRYSVMALMSSYELETPNHFVAPDALRFEVIELPSVDPRRHGWTQPLPAATRIRLHWDVMTTLPQAEIAMCCSPRR